MSRSSRRDKTTVVRWSAPLLCLSLLAAPSLAAAFEPAQHHDSLASMAHTTRSTIVDVLSSDADYSTLIHLLQRTKLIPTLNKLNGSTFFAPTNAAFSSHPPTALYLSLSPEPSSPSLVPDNILHQLRQTLLYHVLNFSSPASHLFPSGSPLPLETLLFPANYSGHTTPDPSPAPPWLPAAQGSLGGEGQRLRAVRREGDGGDWIGVDWRGQGGVQVLEKGRKAGNGVIFKIGGVLAMPPDIGETFLLSV